MRDYSFFSSFFVLILFPTLILFSTNRVLSDPAPSSLQICVVDYLSQTDYNRKILPQVQSIQGSCSIQCQIRNLTTYKASGEFDPQVLSSTLSKEGSNCTILLFTYNEKVTAKAPPPYQEVLKLWMATQNRLLVGPTGFFNENDSGAPLSRTLLGQLPEAILIGELNEKEALLPDSFYGPEMLTALKPTRDKIGQKLVLYEFMENWMRNWKQKTPGQWKTYFKEKKMNSRKLRLALEDLF